VRQTGKVIAIQPDAQSDPLALEAFCLLRTLIEREVDARVRPLEEMLQRASLQNGGCPEEYLDVDALAERIHVAPATIRDWQYKRSKTKIPVVKLPTGTILFPWSQVERWMRGEAV